MRRQRSPRGTIRWLSPSCVCRCLQTASHCYIFCLSVLADYLVFGFCFCYFHNSNLAEECVPVACGRDTREGRQPELEPAARSCWVWAAGYAWCILCLRFACHLPVVCRLGLGLLEVAAGPAAGAPVAAEALALLLRAWSSWASRLLHAADNQLPSPQQQQPQQQQQQQLLQQTRLAHAPWWRTFRDASALLVEAFVHK